MAETLLRTPQHDGVNGTGGARVLRRRRALPSGRAVAGGLLVAVSAIGIFAAYRDAAAGPSRAYVVAARPLSAGSTIRAGDLRLVPVDLPPSLARAAFTETAPLLGTTVLGPVDAGELVQAGGVVRGQANPRRRVSFSLEAARALDGDLRRGDRVDVLATYGSGGADAFTTVVADRVLVAAVSDEGRSISAGRTIVVTLEFDDGRDVLAVTHAVRAGAVTLARSGAGDTGGVYRPTAPDRASPAP